MKELIEKYQKEIEEIESYSKSSNDSAYVAHCSGLIAVMQGFIKDIESFLQSKGKTPTNEDIACEILARFHYTPHPNQRDKYNREKKAFADGAMWVREEYAQSHANKDGCHEYKELVGKLAEWSTAYPRGRIYHAGRKDSMDGELIEIEEKAKELFFRDLPPKPQI